MKTRARLPADLGKRLRALRTVLQRQTQTRGRKVVPARQRTKDAAILHRAAAVVTRYQSEMPLGTEAPSSEDLSILACAITSNAADRGGPANPALQSLIMGLATTFHRDGLRIAVTRDGPADAALCALLPAATGRVAEWETRRGYLREARDFQRVTLGS